MAKAIKKTAPKKEKAPVYEEPMTYELMVIVRADITDEEVEKVLKSIKDEIKTLKGTIDNEDDWGIRDLAYTIKKQNKGYYVILYVTLLPSTLKELNNFLGLKQKVIRHGLFKFPKDYEIKPAKEMEVDENAEKEEKKRVKDEKKLVKKVKEEKEEKKEVEETKEAEVEPEKKEEPAPEKTEEPVEKAEEKEKQPEEEEVEETEPEAEKEDKGKEADKDKDEDKKGKKDVTEMSDIDSKLEKILEDPDFNITL